MRGVAVVLMLALAVSGCGKMGLARKSDPLFDGQRFRADARSERKDRQHFVATMRGVSKSVEGALLAAEFEGTKHCIRYFGTSDIDWQVGPDTPPETFVIDNDSLNLTGTCRDL